MAKKDPSGAAKLMQDLKITLDEEMNKVKTNFANELYKRIPVSEDSKDHARDKMEVKMKRDGRELRVEITLPSYMWAVWRGTDRFIYPNGQPVMYFPEIRWKNGPGPESRGFIQFKYGFYKNNHYTFTQVHQVIKGVEGTPNDFIQNAYNAIDWSKFTRGVVTKLNNKRIYL